MFPSGPMDVIQVLKKCQDFILFVFLLLIGNKVKDIFLIQYILKKFACNNLAHFTKDRAKLLLLVVVKQFI